MAKGIVRLDKVRSVYNGHIESMINESDDMENGMITHLGDLKSDEREIYEVKKPSSSEPNTIDEEPVLLVAAPEVRYEEFSRADAALEKFYIEEGTPFRAYHLERGDIFSVSANMVDGEVGSGDIGDYVVPQDDSFKLNKSASIGDAKFAGEILDIEKIGVEIPVGDEGDVGRINELIVIRVVQN